MPHKIGKSPLFFEAKHSGKGGLHREDGMKNNEWIEYIDESPKQDGEYLVEMIPLEQDPERRRYFANRYYQKGIGFITEKDVIRWANLPE